MNIERINPYVYAGLSVQKQQESRKNKVSSLDVVLDFICDKFETTKEDLRTKKRSRETHVYPRRMFYYLSRKYTLKSLTEIGLTLRQDHATVLHSISECKKDISFIYSEEGKKFSQIEKEFKEKYNLT